MTYKLRSDKTVIRVDPTGDIAAFRESGNTVEKVSVPREDAPAVFDMTTPGGLTIELGSEADLVRSMLHGIPPKTSHGFLGFLGGGIGGGWAGAAGMLPVGGPLGAILGAVIGTMVGGRVKTSVGGVQMSPVVQVKPTTTAKMHGEVGFDLGWRRPKVGIKS